MEDPSSPPAEQKSGNSQQQALQPPPDKLQTVHEVPSLGVLLELTSCRLHGTQLPAKLRYSPRSPLDELTTRLPIDSWMNGSDRTTGTKVLCDSATGEVMGKKATESALIFIDECGLTGLLTLDQFLGERDSMLQGLSSSFAPGLS